MSPKKSALLIVVALLAWAGTAAALDVYLNGVLITGVRNQEFANSTVTLDSQGNVRIHAPQYKVSRDDTTDSGPAGSKTSTTTSPPAKQRPPTIAPAAATATEPPPQGGGSGLARRYWLVAQVNGAGSVQYRIEVRVNGRLVRSFTDANAPGPVEVTEYLRAGRNAVRITADKVNDGGRRSTSSGHWMRVVVADGHIEGSAVVIDTPGVIFTRNASQTDRASRDFTLNAE